MQISIDEHLVKNNENGNLKVENCLPKLRIIQLPITLLVHSR